MISLLSKVEGPELSTPSLRYLVSGCASHQMRKFYHEFARILQEAPFPAVLIPHSTETRSRQKSQLGSTRYPVICVALGNCTDKGEPSNRRAILQAKGG